MLPLPTVQTRRLVYCIAVVDQSFQMSRSEEFVIGVEEAHCDPGPDALLFAGNPGIVVGAVSGGAGIPASFPATQYGATLTERAQEKKNENPGGGDVEP